MEEWAPVLPNPENWSAKPMASPKNAALALFASILVSAPQSARQKDAEKEALSRARESLRDRQETPRREAAQACLRINNEKSIELLLDVLNEANPHSRDIVWESLPSFTDRYARKRVEKELKENRKNSDVREWCVDLLGRFGDAEFGPSVEKALADREIGVKRAAAHALGRLRYAPAASKLDAIAKDRSTDPRLRANAVEALARIDADAHRARFEEALGDPDGGVRCAVLGAMPAIYDDAAPEASAKALRDADWRPRMQAVDNLAAKRTRASVDALVEASGDERPAVRERAIAALRKHTGMKWTLKAQWAEWWRENRESFVEVEEPATASASAAASASASATSAAGEHKYVTYNGITVQSDHVAFLIDKSSDMTKTLSSERREKSEVALDELDATLSRLDPGLLFNVYCYAEELTPFKKRPVELDEKSRKAAVAFVKKAEHEGLKNIWHALSTVIEDPLIDTVFLLSSGEPEVGTYVHWNRVTEHLKDLNRFHKVVIHTIAYSDYKWYRDQLEKIAEATGGQFAFKE